MLVVRFLVSVVVATVLVSFSHSLMVQQGLLDLGVALPGRVRLETMAFDLRGLAPALAAVIALGFGVAFPVAAWLGRRAPAVVRAVAYPLAGAVAVAAALGLMHFFFGMTPIAGARSGEGQALMILSGAVGGLVFGLFKK
ncbi:hypothetical protein [Polymorphobacter sp.]|uniref:hypothetical protein n=1 Tax=Polymorphobacter sp. TaxID=1909290 RepID=UPI003F72892A